MKFLSYLLLCVVHIMYNITYYLQDYLCQEITISLLSKELILYTSIVCYTQINVMCNLVSIACVFFRNLAGPTIYKINYIENKCFINKSTFFTSSKSLLLRKYGIQK